MATVHGGSVNHSVKVTVSVLSSDPGFIFSQSSLRWNHTRVPGLALILQAGVGLTSAARNQILVRIMSCRIPSIHQ